MATEHIPLVSVMIPYYNCKGYITETPSNPSNDKPIRILKPLWLMMVRIPSMPLI